MCEDGDADQEDEKERMAAQEAPALSQEFAGADPGSMRVGHVWLQGEGKTRGIGRKPAEYTLLCSEVRVW